MKSIYRTRKATSRGVVVGIVVLISAVAALVSARSIPFLFAGIVAAFLIAAFLSGQARTVRPRVDAVGWSLIAFLAYGLASAAWAPEPQTTLIKILLGALLVLAGVVTAELIAGETRTNLDRLSEGLWIGLLVGLVYSFIELASDQAIKLWLYNALGLRPDQLKPQRYFEWSGSRLVSISSFDMTRNATPITLLMWSAIMAALATLSSPWNRLVALLIAGLAAAAIAISTHETSKMAIIAGALVFALAHVSLKWTGRLLIVGWVILCLAILPLALLAHRLDLHNASWLQPSAQHRIIIWNHTAEQTFKAPIFGRGAEATYVLGPKAEKSTKSEPDEVWTRTLSIHAHNIYLQTWFELGLVGALLLSAVGVAIVSSAAGLPGATRPYAYATIASAMAVAGSSYGMWQAWFMAMFALAWLSFAIGAHTLARARGEAS